jgi:hypothetical protein
MKRVFAVGAAVLGMLAFTTGAGAITYGVPDHLAESVNR